MKHCYFLHKSPKKITRKFEDYPIFLCSVSVFVPTKIFFLAVFGLWFRCRLMKKYFYKKVACFSIFRIYRVLKVQTVHKLRETRIGNFKYFFNLRSIQTWLNLRPTYQKNIRFAVFCYWSIR